MTVVETTSANIELAPIGVRFADTITVDEWAQFGDRLEQHDRGLRWMIGDWLLFGSERFGARAVVIADSLNLANQTVANAVSICRRVPHERRRPELSFWHHNEIAHLDPDEQVRLLALAVDEGLTQSLLRQVVREEVETRRLTVNSKDSGVHGVDSDPMVDSSAPPSRPVGPVTVTFVLAGELPADRSVIDDGVGRVREGLEAWFGGHGYATTVELR